MTSLRTLFSALLLLAACGDDDDTMMMPDTDGGMMPMIDAGPPPEGAVAIEVSVNPPRAAYQTEQSIRMQARVLDADENELTGLEVSWSVSPESAVTEAGMPGVYTLVEEGAVEITGCVMADDGSDLCDNVRILVDADSPNLEVISPTPGAELGGDGTDAISVTGSVADTREVRVFVNGVEGEIDEMGNFTVMVPPLFGVNHIEVVATDGLSNDSQVEMDVLWADWYVQASTSELQPEISFPDAMTLQLGQNFFDDGVDFDRDADPIVAGDLADVLELVLERVDFQALLPDPVLDNAPTIFLRITDVRSGNIDAQVNVIDGGAEVFMRIGGLEADTEGGLEFEGTMLGLGGGLSASLSAYARIDASKAGPMAPIVSEISELTVAIESVDGRFDEPEANAILRLAEGLLRTTLESAIADVMNDALLDALPAVLSNALSSLDTLLMGQRLDLMTDLFPAVTLTLDGRLASLDTQYRSWMRAPVQLAVGTESDAIHPESRGAADIPGPDEPPLFSTQSVQLAVRLAVLNGLLHSLWNSGLLEIDATTLLPADIQGLVSEAHLSGKMAPVLRPARGDESQDLVLVVGQGELEAVVTGDTMVFGITIEAGASATITDGSVALELDEEPSLRVWLISSTNPRPLVTADTLESLLRQQLWPELRTSVTEGLQIEVPSFDLGDLSGLSPDLASLNLSFSLADRLRIRQNYLILDLAIRGELDPMMTTM